MATKHLTVHKGFIKRSDGRSAVASASYRASEKLHDERLGRTFEFNRRAERVNEAFILTPANAPSWASDRGRLWNEAERRENRANSQPAADYMIALPNCMTEAEQKELITEYCEQQLVKNGQVADVSLHDQETENPHAHVMATTRCFDKNGEWEKNKIRTNKADLKNDRKAYMEIGNCHLERLGYEDRIEVRSFKELEIEQAPTKHLGVEAHAMEQRGEKTERGDHNQEVKAFNLVNIEDYKALQAKKRQIKEEIAKEKAFLMIAESNASLSAVEAELAPIREAENRARIEGGIKSNIRALEAHREVERCAVFERKAGRGKRIASEHYQSKIKLGRQRFGLQKTEAKAEALASIHERTLSTAFKDPVEAKARLEAMEWNGNQEEPNQLREFAAKVLGTEATTRKKSLGDLKGFTLLGYKSSDRKEAELCASHVVSQHQEIRLTDAQLETQKGKVDAYEVEHHRNGQELNKVREWRELHKDRGTQTELYLARAKALQGVSLADIMTSELEHDDKQQLARELVKYDQRTQEREREDSKPFLIRDNEKESLAQEFREMRAEALESVTLEDIKKEPTLDVEIKEELLDEKAKAEAERAERQRLAFEVGEKAYTEAQERRAEQEQEDEQTHDLGR